MVHYHDDIEALRAIRNELANMITGLCPAIGVKTALVDELTLVSNRIVWLEKRLYKVKE